MDFHAQFPKTVTRAGVQLFLALYDGSPSLPMKAEINPVAAPARSASSSSARWLHTAPFLYLPCLTGSSFGTGEFMPEMRRDGADFDGSRRFSRYASRSFTTEKPGWF
jgi:hypothetical protein